MNWNMWVRQIHRWLSIAFTGTVVANFGALGVGRPPVGWSTRRPLPLGLPLLTGLYMFVLPEHTARLRSARSAGGVE